MAHVRTMGFCHHWDAVACHVWCRGADEDVDLLRRVPLPGASLRGGSARHGRESSLGRSFCRASVAVAAAGSETLHVQAVGCVPRIPPGNPCDARVHARVLYPPRVYAPAVSRCGGTTARNAAAGVDHRHCSLWEGGRTDANPAHRDSLLPGSVAEVVRYDAGAGTTWVTRMVHVCF